MTPPRRCASCARELPERDFYEELTRHGRYKRRSTCMDCFRAKRRERYWRAKGAIEVVRVQRGANLPDGYQAPSGAHAGGGHDGLYVVRAWRNVE